MPVDTTIAEFNDFRNSCNALALAVMLYGGGATRIFRSRYRPTFMLYLQSELRVLLDGSMEMTRLPGAKYTSMRLNQRRTRPIRPPEHEGLRYWALVRVSMEMDSDLQKIRPRRRPLKASDLLKSAFYVM